MNSLTQKLLGEVYSKNVEELRLWASKRVFGLFIFNIIVVLLILLYTAGYFSPFFPLTINFITLCSLILAVILLGIRSKILIMIALLFWLFAAFLRIINIEVWAERTSIYSYQALVLGILILIFELRKEKI